GTRDPRLDRLPDRLTVAIASAPAGARVACARTLPWLAWPVHVTLTQGPAAAPAPADLDALPRVRLGRRRDRHRPRRGDRRGVRRLRRDRLAGRKDRLLARSRRAPARRHRR